MLQYNGSTPAADCGVQSIMCGLFAYVVYMSLQSVNQFRCARTGLSYALESLQPGLFLCRRCKDASFCNLGVIETSSSCIYTNQTLYRVHFHLLVAMDGPSGESNEEDVPAPRHTHAHDSSDDDFGAESNQPIRAKEWGKNRSTKKTNSDKKKFQKKKPERMRRTVYCSHCYQAGHRKDGKKCPRKGKSGCPCWRRKCGGCGDQTKEHPPCTNCGRGEEEDEQNDEEVQHSKTGYEVVHFW